MYYEVIPARLFGTTSGVLTYSSNLSLQPGHLVTIPLGKTSTVGMVVQSVPAPKFKTKPISKLLLDQPLPPHIQAAIFWFEEYYLTPLPTALKLFLPTGITRKRRAISPEKTEQAPKLPLIPLGPAQKTALSKLQESPAGTKLLHGITGSGKTNIYLKLAENTLKQQKSVIVLVPEIALTSQLVRVFTETFGTRITLIHSRQTEAHRHQTWLQLLNSTTPKIIIGPRSALLSPIANLGLIIIDESHESAYFQENPPRYSALRLASFMAQTLRVSCIQGTATPLVTDYYLAKTKQAIVPLNVKAKDATPPESQIVSLLDRTSFTKNRYFSNQLLSAIDQNLANHHQTLIFHNRRGSAPLTICGHCGYQLNCPHCFLPLSLHGDAYQLLCHTCGYHTTLPTSCPECHHPSLIHKGFGTKLLESELKKLYPKARIARFDTDSAKNQTLDALYHTIHAGGIDIIIGTQTLARGLDLPHLATVGIAQADTGLSLPDYSAEERTFHLLTQVMGRVGRGHLTHTQVITQTFQPDHPVINFALHSDYAGFSKYLLAKRRNSALPPFTHLAKLSVTYKTEATTLAKIRALHQAILKVKNIQVSAPTPAFYERTRQGFTWQLIIKSSTRSHLLQLITKLNQDFKFRFTLDPPSLI